MVTLKRHYCHISLRGPITRLPRKMLLAFPYLMDNLHVDIDTALKTSEEQIGRYILVATSTSSILCTDLQVNLQCISQYSSVLARSPTSCEGGSRCRKPRPRRAINLELMQGATNHDESIDGIDGSKFEVKRCTNEAVQFLMNKAAESAEAGLLCAMNFL